MTSKLTRERVVALIAEHSYDSALVDALEHLLAAMDSEPVAWTDEQELRDVDRGGCGYLFTVNPVTPHADERRIILLYRHAQPAPVLKSVGYLFVSEQGAIAYSPTDWGMPGFRLAGQIFGDIDVELKPAPVVPLPDVVSVLLNHLEDVLPDDAFNLIDVKAWNAVSMLTCPDACRAAMLNGGKS